MTIVRWNAGRELPSLPGDVLSMQREINRMFDSFFRDSRHDDRDLFPAAWMPAADLVEREHDFVVRMDLPGVDRNDVKITIQDNVLTIRGEKKEEKEVQGANSHRIERSSGSFARSFSLPAEVSSEKIEALCKDGVLTVTLPKSEAAKPRQIDVKVK
jgi:HSP20 family protein